MYSELLFTRSILFIFFVLIASTMYGGAFAEDSGTYARDETCKQCHEDMAKSFSQSYHSRAMVGKERILLIAVSCVTAQQGSMPLIHPRIRCFPLGKDLH